MSAVDWVQTLGILAVAYAVLRLNAAVSGILDVLIRLLSSQLNERKIAEDAIRDMMMNEKRASLKNHEPN